MCEERNIRSGSSLVCYSFARFPLLDAHFLTSANVQIISRHNSDEFAHCEAAGEQWRSVFAQSAQAHKSKSTLSVGLLERTIIGGNDVFNPEVKTFIVTNKTLCWALVYKKYEFFFILL